MKIHIVKKGDSLFAIAGKYGVELDKLIAANPQIADPDRIEPGMKVKIPAVPKLLPHSPYEHVHQHTVVQGDTLWKLSKTWNVSLKSIIEANPHIKNPSILMTGETIYIPKVNPDGTLSGSNVHANPVGPAGKKLTAPKEELLQPIEKEAEVPPPVPEAPVAEKIPEKPVEVEAPVIEKIPEKPVEIMPVVEKPVEEKPVIEKPVIESPVMEKPMMELPMMEIPMMEKPVIESPIMEKPVIPNPVMGFPPVQQPLAAPLAEMPVTPYPTAETFMTAPNPPGPMFVEPAYEAKKPLCPPLPEEVSPFYMGYPHPGGTAIGSYPYVEHPFQQQQIPAVEAMAGVHTGAYPADGDVIYPYAAGGAPVSPYSQVPQVPGVGGVQTPYPSPVYGVEQVPTVLPDCGCGGGLIHDLPYAVSPYGVNVPSPYGVGGFPGIPDNVQPPVGIQPAEIPAQPPAALPYGVTTPLAGPTGPFGPDIVGAGQQPALAGTIYPYAQQPYHPFGPLAYSPLSGVPCFPIAGLEQELSPTFVTPYSNPYAFPGLSPQTVSAPIEGPGGTFGVGPGLESAAVSVRTEQDKAADSAQEKNTQVRSAKSKSKSDKAVIQSFLKKQSERSKLREPKESTPWINR